MDKNETAAFIQSQAACALIEMEAMKIENRHKISVGDNAIYSEDAFQALISKYGIDHNAVMTLIRNTWEV